MIDASDREKKYFRRDTQRVHEGRSKFKKEYKPEKNTAAGAYEMPGKI